ncbi:hypothetical protein IMSAG049_00810 [Clostridiales bacterium]|nr:hypothetical protein IMSAG049_00810 [Clostridiales bacterium]
MKGSYHPYAIITILFWSLAYAFTKLALQHFSPYSLGFLRYLVATCVLVIVASATKMKPPHSKDIPLFIASGASGFFLYMVTFNKGAATVSSATGSVIVSTAPVITAVMARFIYKERLRFFQWIAIIIQFVGVLILTLLDGSISVNYGLIWLFGAALALSMYNLFQRRLTKTYTSMQTSAFSIFFGSALLAVFSPAAIREVSSAPPSQLFYLAVLGIFSSAIAYLTWSKAFSKAEKTSQVSNYMFITPFSTSLLSFIIIGEVPDRATVIGGAVIILGTLVFNFGGKLFNQNNI